MPKIACVGSHGGHQGMYLSRGRSPMNWTILAGEKYFTISLFKIINNDADSGPEIFRQKIEISLTDDINDIYFKLSFSLIAITKFLKNTKNINFTKYKGITLTVTEKPAEGFVDSISAAIGSVPTAIIGSLAFIVVVLAGFLLLTRGRKEEEDKYSSWVKVWVNQLISAKEVGKC